jgi:hypothetical protein
MTSPRRSLLVAALAIAQGSVFPLSAQHAHVAGAGAAPSAVRLEIVDRTPRFLTFYDAAVAEGAGPQRRWELWKEHYDYAALPPVPQRDSLARALLDDAWPRYPGAMERIRAGAAGMRPDPEAALRSVASLLRADSLTVRLVAYVGALENNAFFYAQDGVLSIVVPVDPEPEARENVLFHELAHAVHHRLAGFSEGWERTIARTLFAEGLASRAAQALLPGREDAAYLEHRPGWFAEAAGRREAILRGIAPALHARDSETVMRFTMGTGTTGVEREAYYAGWLVVGDLLERGWTLAELARVHEDEIPALVEQSIARLLGESAR